MADGNFNAGSVGKFSGWAADMLFLLGLAFLSNALGPLTRATNTAAGFACIALSLTMALPNRFPANLLLTSFLYALFIALYYYVSPIWQFSQIISELTSNIIANSLDHRQLFGSTAFGLPILTLFVIFIFSTYLLSDRTGQSPRLSRLYLLITILALLVIHAFWVVLHEPALEFFNRAFVHDQHRHNHLTPMHLLSILFIFDLMPTTLWVRTCKPAPLSYAISSSQWPKTIWVAAIFFLAAFVLRRPDSISLSTEKKNVFILNRGYFNWEKPKFGQYGLTSSGMFGLLPNYLQALDYNVTVDSLLTTENLQRAHVFVVINLHRMLDEQEKRDIGEFVKNGGSLLVLGDHTGLGEMMPPLNDLLKDTGIQFNFDSAHYLKDGWNHAFEWAPHPINALAGDEDDVGISVGASLALSPFKARPVITAKYGFSDIGNWLNKQNAYLGDRQYNPGEWLGDIVLVAESAYGKGKILVFGDTSSLQNGAMARNFVFVDGVLRWLSNSPNSRGALLRVIFGIALLLLATAWVLNLFHKHKNAGFLMLAFGVFVASFLINSAFAAAHKTQTAPRGNVAYIDMAHLERFEIYSDGGIWSLLYTLMRCDYLPFVHQRFSPRALESSKVLIKIAPAKPLSEAAMQRLDDYLRQGGVVIWAVGYEEKEGSEEFLRNYGLSIDNVPLGPVSKTQNDRGLSFHKAWPITFSDSSQVEVLCSGWNYPLIIRQRIGKGKLVLIGDSEFLLARNLEGASRPREENLRFIQTLLP